MTKTIGFPMLVIGAAWWVLAIGAAEASAQPATEPSAPPARELTLDLGNKVTTKLVLIPAGTFMMGSPKSEKDRNPGAEDPQHEVTISKPFYMGVYEVTQAEYEQVTGKNPGSFKGPAHPAGNMSWSEAVDFCKKLSQKTGRTVRLPTEAEWEYACRAGSTTRFYYGDDDDKLDDYAWYAKNSDDKLQAVGQKKPNAWGLYDVHGNVWEWCSDWREPYTNAKNIVDPTGSEYGSNSGHVIRGGSFYRTSAASQCRSACRGGEEWQDWPNMRCDPVGFRVVVNSQVEAPQGPGRLPAVAAEPSPQPATPPSTQPAKELTLDLGNEVTMKLVEIPAGKFLMGSPKSEKDRGPYESQREVTISTPFYMGVYEVTQAQYEQVMGKNPSTGNYRGPANPAGNMPWTAAAEFCGKLSQKTGKTVRLPTEAEWEYACRAGSTTRFHYGDDNNGDNLDDYMWYGKNSPDKTHAVGQKKPNAWGLYDVHGNVYEWVNDWNASYTNAKNVVDPTGPASGTRGHIIRSGSVYRGCAASQCRSAYRNGEEGKNMAVDSVGFRVVVNLK